MYYAVWVTRPNGDRVHVARLPQDAALRETLTGIRSWASAYGKYAAEPGAVIEMERLLIDDTDPEDTGDIGYPPIGTIVRKMEDGKLAYIYPTSPGGDTAYRAIEE